MYNYKIWISYATEDLESAEIMHREGLYNKSVFSCHQAAEKILKACCIAVTGDEEPFARLGHDLIKLSKYIREHNFYIYKNIIDHSYELNNYYFDMRYPDCEVRVIDEEESLDALEKSRNLYFSCIEWLEYNFSY